MVILVSVQTAHAQVSGDIAVEVTVLSKSTLKPLQNASVFLFQSTGTGATGSGFFTNSNGFVQLETFPIEGSSENHLEILCQDLKHKKQYPQILPMYSQLQVDRVYQRTIYLDVPSKLTICDQ